MRKRKVFLLAGFIFIMILATTACAKSDMTRDSGSNSMNGTEGGFDTTAEAPATARDIEDGATGNVDLDDKANSDNLSNSTALTTGDLQQQSQDKIITTYDLEVETQTFDNLVKNINDKIKSLGGYVESSQIGGKSYYNDNAARNASIVARIPAKSCDEFVNTVDKEANITNNRASTENVTLQYVDTQSKIKALTTEQDRLYAILEKTKDLDSVITLESRLSDIRYQLENYDSQLRIYDNKVQYSTVTMNITEVKHLTPETKVKASMASRIKTGFGNTLYHIGNGFQNFVVWFIVNLPYLLIWGLIILVITLFGIRIYRKNTSDKKPNDTQNKE